MKNEKIAKKLDLIATYLELDGVDYSPFAYRRASFSVLNMEKPLEEIYKKEKREGIEKLSGIGINIADKIEELFLTGEIEYLKDLQKKFPVDIESLLKVKGLGPKGVKKLYKELGVKSLKDLKEKTENGEVAKLDGFGEKTAQNILESLSFFSKEESRWSLENALSVCDEIIDKIKELKEVTKISSAGSLRRKKETIGDIDILVSAKDSSKIMDFFTSLKNVKSISGKGETKSSVILEDGLNVDLRVVKKESFGSALQYFTGSKNHNIKLRKLAIKKGFKLNEYGLFDKETQIAGENEKSIYQALELPYIIPELREDKGEIEEAIKGNDFSDLCQLEDIKGDLHIHSNWNGGLNPIEEIVKEAQKRNYFYIGIADHTKFLRIENGLDEETLEKQKEEIEKIDKKYKEIKILQGCEANILNDGSLDISDKALKKLDYVIAGIHSSFGMNQKDMTERVIKAIKHPKISIISHPTGRLIKRRDSLNLDMEKVFKVAKKEKVILEVNSSLARLDLNDKNINYCINNGIKIIINSDAHEKRQLKNIEYGIWQAKRGWAKKEDVVNSYNLKDLLKILK